MLRYFKRMIFFETNRHIEHIVSLYKTFKTMCSMCLCVSKKSMCSKENIYVKTKNQGESYYQFDGCALFCRERSRVVEFQFYGKNR